MTLTISTLISAIKRHLSVIGKRLYDKEGKNLFSNVTLSSAEDTEILTQYINSSAQNIEALLKQFVTASSYGTTISMTITNTRGDSDFDTRTTNLSESYIIQNTVAEYLAMVNPDYAQKYYADAKTRMEALATYVFYKNPPKEAASDPLSGVSTQVS